jgi:3-methyl-2-oxobutanoate hydroxymethyltransferase
MGGYKVQGKTLEAAEQLMKDATALDHAGVFSIVLEGIPREVAAMITAEVSVPTIGIGAGPECDGQILVYHDLLGLTFTPPAKFVRRYADLGSAIRDAISAYKDDVEAGAYPNDAESYHMPKDAGADLARIRERKQAMELKARR